MTTSPEETQKDKAQKSEKLFMENTLLRISGALFCHDAKRAPTRKEQFVLNRGVVEKHIVIRPDPEFGQPGPLAHKVLMALIKKHSDYGRPIQNEVSFSQRELIRLIDRVEAGRAHHQILRALNEIAHTRVTAFFKKGERYFERSFSLFPEVLLERSGSFTGPIQSCSVTLAEPIIESLRDDHFTCLNHFLMQRLGTIGQALYIRLFFHFANLYEEQGRKRGLLFQKHYGDICAEWLGGLTVRAHKSLILRDQLGPHLEQLKNVGFISSFDIEKAKTRDGFVMTFRPGSAFYQDYERFYRHRNQGELQWEFNTDQREIAEPLKLASLFERKRTGKEALAVASISQKESETAKFILSEVSFDDSDMFLDFAMGEARKTKFEVKTLGGLRQYVATFLAHRDNLKRAKSVVASQKAREVRDLSKAVYDRHRRDTALAFFNTLPAADQEAIEAVARRKAGSFGSSSLKAIMLDMEKAKLTTERHGENMNLPSFEDWQKLRS